MPRTGSDSGYQAMPVCAFCIENLNITAGSKAYMKSLSLARLRKYVNAYNIKVDGVLEKDELIARIILSRRNNGCLPPANEEFYRRYSVPSRQSGRPRGLFSRDRPPPQTSAPRPPQQANPSSGFARPDLDPSYRQQQAPPQRQGPRPQAQQQHTQSSTRSAPYSPRQTPPPTHFPRPRYAHDQDSPGPHTRPNSTHPSANTQGAASGRLGPSRPVSAAPTVPASIPTLEQLLDMTEDAVSKLSIGTLKSVLFQNHVNAGLILEKSDLVTKVRALVEDERREREREAALRAREEQDIIDRQHAMMEEHREREESMRQQREARGQEEQAASADGNNTVGGDQGHIVRSGAAEADGGLDNSGEETNSERVKAKTSNHLGGPSLAGLERNGLCVICQDEEANIAIVDCGHLAMCRGCSELVMTSSRECPLCRTRIVTEARLLRIFKT
ncbi:hypothetical protein EW146_g3275 [Bondarzewia mesenterica]|uniref:RING-type domain-containing protein n=1 Tax=Bondarzewia mesenterica TaxID=1095465 RepID=A0A4S4M097_9AGAM|nr:hypothetical protein EW146_g3275 [Bondarzewia mesenterica]